MTKKISHQGFFQSGTTDKKIDTDNLKRKTMNVLPLPYVPNAGNRIDRSRWAKNQLNLDWRNRYKPVKQFIISWLKDRERRMIDWFQNESRKKILDIILLLCLSIIIQKIDRFEKAKRFKDLILIFFIKQKKNQFKFKAKQSTHSIDFFRFVVPVVVSLVGWLKKN